VQIVGAVLVERALVKPGAVGAKRPTLGGLLLEHVLQVRLEDAGVDSGASNHRDGRHRPCLWTVGRGLLLLLERCGIDSCAFCVKRDAHRLSARGGRVAHFGGAPGDGLS
jgi:hypothetical protein